MNYNKIFFIIILFFYGATLFSQKIDSIPTIEITASRIISNEVGHTIQKIDSSTLLYAIHQNIGNLLQNNASINSIAYSNGLNGLSIRGTASRHTAVLWNGINLQNSLSGLADFSNWSTGLAENISLQTGGESALFGSGAIGGVVFLNNSIQKKKGSAASIHTNVGSFNSFNNVLKASFGTGKWAIQGTYSHQKADNNFKYRNIAKLNQPIERAENAAFEYQHVLLSAYCQLNARQFLKANGWWQHNFRQLTPTMTSANTHPEQKDFSWRGVLEYIAFLDKQQQHRLSTRFSYLDDYLFYESDLVKNSRNTAQNKIFETDYEWKKSDHQITRVGLNFTQNDAISTNFLTFKRRNRYALFASQQFLVHKFDFLINLRQELVQQAAIPFTFRLGTNYTLNNFSTIRTSFSKNYNLPALNDLFWAAVGNPQLLPESSFSYDLTYSIEKKGQSNTLKSNLTLFGNTNHQKIVWQAEKDGIWRPSNLDFSRAFGIESSSKYSFFYITQHAVQLNYSLTKSMDKNGFQLIYIPIHSFSSSYKLQWKKIAFDYSQNFSSRRFMTSDNSIWTKAFSLANLNVAYRFDFKKVNLSTHLQVLNLWNTDYQIIQYYPNPKRNFNFSLHFSTK